jgi:hypothetical protein
LIPVFGDFADPGSLQAPAAQVDAIVSTASIGQVEGTPDSFAKDRDAVAVITKALGDSGKPLIFTSGSAIFGVFTKGEASRQREDPKDPGLDPDPIRHLGTRGARLLRRLSSMSTLCFPNVQSLCPLAAWPAKAAAQFIVTAQRNAGRVSPHMLPRAFGPAPGGERRDPVGALGAARSPLARKRWLK